MTPERWTRLKQLFEQALAVDPPARLAFVNQACAGDASLQRSLLALLDHHETTRGLDASSLTSDLAQIVLAHLRAFVPGELVANRFLVERFLGEGGMGEVYAAEDRELGGRVALKTIRPELARDEQMLARFKREVALTRTITHRNVSRVYDLLFHQVDVFDAPRTVVFVSMELLEGETLAANIRRAGRLNPRDAQKIALQLLAGLDAAHKEGVIHGDFKSGNIVLVSESGYLERVVIVDFGLASTLRVEAGEAASSQIMGTPAYMAPEQVERGEVTRATDIYALGIVLFEMISGVLPFRGDSPIETAQLRLTQDAPSLQSVMEFVPARWDDAIQACLQRDPVARPWQLPEIGQRLMGRYEKPGAMQARLEQAYAQRQRSRWSLGGNLLTILLIALWDLWYWLQPSPGPGAEAQAAMESARLSLANHTRSGFRAAVSDYQHAGELESRWALPWSELAGAYAVATDAQWIPVSVGRAEVRTAATWAMQLDEHAATALAALGWSQSLDLNEWRAAEATLRKAIEFNPRDGRFYHWLGITLRLKGRFAEASIADQQALELTRRADPSCLVELATLCWTEGQMERLDILVTELLQAYPNERETRFWYARLLKARGQFDAAIAELDFSERLGSSPVLTAAERASIEAHRGNAAVARQILVSIEDADRRTPVDTVLVAGVYAKLGDNDAAIRWLERGYARGDSTLLAIATDPTLKPLRRDPRFIALCGKLHDDM